MNATRTVTPHELNELLLHLAPVRPVFIWGPPGIGKSSIVQEFAAAVGLECVSLLGSQLAPEDLIGIPQIENGVSRFCPPASIARKEPYCLFLDELNACSHEVQKAFYSLIHERRIGEYNAACDVVVARFLADMKLGRAPEEPRPYEPPVGTEDRLYDPIPDAIGSEFLLHTCRDRPYELGRRRQLLMRRVD